MISSSSGGGGGGGSEEEERSSSRRSTGTVAVSAAGGGNVGAGGSSVGGDAAAAMSCLELDAWIRDDDGTIDCMMMLPEMPLDGDDDSTSPEEDSSMHQDRCDEFEHKDEMIFCRSSSNCSSTFPDSCANQETLELNLPDDFFDRQQQHDEDHHRHSNPEQQQQRPPSQRQDEILRSSPPAFVPDLRKIIVKKPVMDKAVERLGGGRRGAMRLWNIIQVWLKHQSAGGGGSGSLDGLTLQLENFGGGGGGGGFAEMPFHHHQHHNDRHFQHPVLSGFGGDANGGGGGQFFGDGGGGGGGGGHFFSGDCGGDATATAAARTIPPCSSSAAAATTRAARKSRMARQRRHKGVFAASHSPPVSSGAWSSAPPSSAAFLASGATTATTTTAATSLPTTHATPGARELQQHNFGSCRDGIKARMACDKSVKFLLQKELKPSDVGNLGRIVLPKKEAEVHLPFLSLREGVTLAMEDVLTAQTWHFRYRFWPNNKSRMYLLEGTGEFVKSHLLREGDLIQIYRDVKSGKHIILAKKLAKTKSHVKTAVERTTATTTIMTTTAAASHKQVEEDCLSGASTVSDSSIDQQKKRIGCKINARKRKIFAKQDPVPAPSSGGKTNSGGGGGGGDGREVVEKFPSVEMEDEFIDEILGMVDADEPSSPESCKEDD